jgi:hypothetical protein
LNKYSHPAASSPAPSPAASSPSSPKKAVAPSSPKKSAQKKNKLVLDIRSLRLGVQPSVWSYRKDNKARLHSVALGEEEDNPTERWSAGLLLSEAGLPFDVLNKLCAELTHGDVLDFGDYRFENSLCFFHCICFGFGDFFPNICVVIYVLLVLWL